MQEQEVCPNGCVDGWIINPYKHTRTICPYCRDKRKEEVKERDTIMEDLNLPEGYIPEKFSFEDVIPSGSRGIIEEASLADVAEVSEKLIAEVSAGNLPEESIMFNLGASVYEQNFLLPLITKGYISGLKVSDLIEVPVLMAERRKYSYGEENKFSDYLKSDLCVVSIDAGTDRDGLLAVKGLMQLRARRYLPTIMITHVWNRYVRDLTNPDEDYKSYELARLVSVVYKKRNGFGVTV